jgi:hypothetical protein
MNSKKKLLRRSVYTYGFMLVINPIIILSFQNCSRVKLNLPEKEMQAHKTTVERVVQQNPEAQ